MTAATNKKSPMVSILHGHQCVGFTISRGCKGIEAFDVEARSLGIFADELAAIAAISQSAR